MENFTYNRDTFPRNRLAKIINRIRIIEENATRKTTKMELEHTTIKVVFVNSQLNYIKPNIQANYKKGISWSYPGGNTNALVHAISGNKKIGYKAAAWNCRRGLIKSDGSPGAKMTDIKLYLQKHDLDLFGIIESDLHGNSSRVYRAHPLSTCDILQKLQVPGYTIILPQSWYNHGQARLILFIKEGLHIKERKLRKEDSDLPSISIELGLGREKKTCFNVYYREFTGGVSGLKDLNSQKERLERQISHWKTLYT